MSALAFQNVMALLIRFPTDSLEDLQKKLGDPELTSKEQDQLRQMSVDPLVRKFGQKMRFSRQRDATKIMRLSKDMITPEVFSSIYLELFEPSQTSINLETIGIQFIDFCLSDPRALEKLAGEVPYLTDVLRYERARAVTELDMVRENDPRLPQGSCLRHPCFQILDFQYDIPAIDRVKVKDPDSRPEPKLKPSKMIFMTVNEYPYCRIFQIDQAIESFLTVQLKNPDQWESALPAAYDGMVKVGLCRPLS